MVPATRRGTSLGDMSSLPFIVQCIFTPGLRALTHNPTNRKKQPHHTLADFIFLFFFNLTYVVSKNQYLVSAMLKCVCFFYSGECLLYFLLFLIHAGSFLDHQEAKTLAFWMGLPYFFFFSHCHFCMKKKIKSWLYKQIWCTKEKKFHLVFHDPITQRNCNHCYLFCFVWCFSEVCIIMNVNLTVTDFNRTRYVWGKKRGGDIGPHSIFWGNDLLMSCQQLNLYCTFSTIFKANISYISCVLGF